MSINGEWIVIDYETASVCDLKVAGAARYAEDPTTEILCMAYQASWMTSPEVWLPGELMSADLTLAVENPEVFFIAFNALFEKSIWRGISQPVYDWPDIPNRRWHDVMAMCAMKVIPLDLASAIQFMGLTHEKDMAGSKLTKGLSKADKRGRYDRSQASLGLVAEYCRQDIRGTVELHKRLGWMPAAERNVWLLDQQINERGVMLDRKFVGNARRIVERASVPLLQEFRNLTGANVGQVQKVMTWMQEQGVYIPNLQKETIAALLGADDDDEAGEIPNGITADDLPADAHRAMYIRSLVGSASVKKLPRMEACLCSDGRAHGILQYHGAGPGLWSGRLFQPQNFPRGTIRIGAKAPAPEIVIEAVNTGDPEYIEMVLGPAVEVVVSGLRHAIVAKPRHALVVGDFAGIQTRTVLAMAGQHDKTMLMAAGKDIYLDMAAAIYGAAFTGDVEQRQIGKNSVLGLGFQMGAKKFRMRYAKDHFLDFCENVVQTYRKEWAPCVPKVWYALQDAAVRAAWDHKRVEAYGITYELDDIWMTARLPSGRKIWYAKPVPFRQTMPWSTPDNPDVRRAWWYQGRKNGRMIRVNAFGGLLTENVVMGMQRDLLVAAMMKCKSHGLNVILNVHDEIICETEIASADPSVLKQIMEDIPDWARQMQIPVAAECWMGARYKK